MSELSNRKKDLCNIISRVEGNNKRVPLVQYSQLISVNYEKVTEVNYFCSSLEEEMWQAIYLITGINSKKEEVDVKYFYCKKQMEKELKQIQKYIEHFK